MTVTVSDKGQISIPKAVREEMGIRRGEQLVLIESGGRLVLEHASRVARKLSSIDGTEQFLTMLSSQRSLSKDWDNEEDERWNFI